MIPRIGHAARFEHAVRRIGRHKGSRLLVETWLDYGNRWTVAMEWGCGATRRRNAVSLPGYGGWRRGKRRKSPEHMALTMVRALAAWRCRKRVMRKRRTRR